MTPDPRPQKRYRASQSEWSAIHEAFEDDRCWVCGEVWTELHHILSRGQGGDDVVVNLAPVDRECHARIEARDPVARSLIRQALMPSNYGYLRYKLGETVEGWLERSYPVVVLGPRERHAGATTNLKQNQVLDLQAISRDDKPPLEPLPRTNVA